MCRSVVPLTRLQIASHNIKKIIFNIFGIKKLTVWRAHFSEISVVFLHFLIYNFFGLSWFLLFFRIFLIFYLYNDTCFLEHFFCNGGIPFLQFFEFIHFFLFLRFFRLFQFFTSFRFFTRAGCLLVHFFVTVECRFALFWIYTFFTFQNFSDFFRVFQFCTSFFDSFLG